LASKVVAADACVLLNLLATGQAGDLLRALDTSLIATPLAAAEVKYLAGPPDEEGRPTRQTVDLAELTGQGLLVVKAVPQTALELHVRCAADLHEADASSIALAVGCGVPLATDDGLARRVAAREATKLALVGTLALVRGGGAAMGIDREGLVKLARNLRARGNFLPPRQDPDREWYQNLLSSDA
jgi:predicted nucleic acid-binding protein